jgi:hypothetical protein
MVSLLVSFVLTPMMCSRWLKRKVQKKGRRAVRRVPVPGGHGEVGPKSAARTAKPRAHGGIYWAIEGFYMRILGWSMLHRWVIVLVVRRTFSRSFRSAGWPTRTSSPTRTSRSTRSPARARGHQPRRDAHHRRRASPPSSRSSPRASSTPSPPSATTRRRRPTSRPSTSSSKPPTSASARSIELIDHARREIAPRRAGSSASRSARSPPSPAAAQLPRHVPDHRARSAKSSRSIRRLADRRDEEAARRGRPGHLARRRQARASRR